MAKRNNKTGEITFKEEENPILVKEVEEKRAKSNIDDLLAAIKLMNSNLNDNFKDLTNNVSTLSKNITEVNKKPSEKTKKVSTKADTKLLDAVTSTNENIGKLVKALSEQNKPKRNRRTQEQLSVDRIKADREKALNDHNAKLYALKEKEIQQRMDLTKKSHESYMKKHYAEDSLAYKAITSPYRAYNNIQSQGSNSLSALGISLLSGGIINPVIAKEFGLDKILTGTTKFAGRTFAKAGATAWNMTGGLALKNLAQPFVNKDSRLRQGMASGANKVSNAFSNPLSLFKKDETVESDGKQVGAVAKDKDKLAKIEKNTQDMVNLLSKPKDETQPKEKEKKKSLLDKIFEAIGGMGLILKGAAVAAIPYVVKAFLPKAVEWLDEKFKGFLTGTIGLSEESSEGVSQLVKDALPGALFGFTIGGWKGALFGGALSIGINWLKAKWDEFKGNSNNEGKPPAKIGPIPLSYAEAMIGGAVAGSLFGHPFAGMLLGLAGQGLWDLGQKFGEWTADAINWLADNPITTVGMSLFGLANLKNIKKGAVALYNVLSGANFSLGSFKDKVVSVTKNIASLTFDKVKTGISSLGSALKSANLNITSGIKTNITSILPKVKSSLLGLGKAAGFVGAAIMAWDIGKWLGEKLGDKIEGDKAKKEHEKVQTKADIVNSMSKEELGKYNQWLQDTGQWNGFAQGYTVEEGLIWDSKNDYDYNKSLEQFRNAQQALPEKYGIKADGQGGGYGTLGPSSYGNIIHGTKATGLKDIGLKGTVVSSNSIPFIASQNEQSLKALDETLNGWGYDVIYTSAMGGHRPGTGHWKGNKVDLQLKKNGRPTHLSGQQLNILGQAGYWGRGTGALGWEPVSGQVGGGHYDLYIAGGNSGTALASAANIKLETKDMPTAQEAQTFAMNEMNETTQAAAENTANSNDSILGMLDSMNNNIASNATSPTGGYSGGSSFNTASVDMPSISLSIPGQGGGNDKRDNTVYAFGDVAKTPILYTM